MILPLRLVLAAMTKIGLRKPKRHPLLLIRDAANRGEVEAQFQIGQSYIAGWSLPRHPATAAMWLELAANQGHALAQHSLSLLYMSGAVASGEAAQWFKETRSEAAASANATLLYPQGLDVTAAPEMAFVHAKSAAEQGLACAQANLGMFYLRGIGCIQDFSKAQEWFRRAAEQHDSVGALGLGLIHEHGLAITRALSEAARWYAIGAELGNDTAATALGLLYLDGLGVPFNPVKARLLLSGPASRGDTMAQKGLAELGAMTDLNPANDSRLRNDEYFTEGGQNGRQRS